MYARNEGKAWIPTMLLTGSLFPLSCFSIAAVLNTIAIAYHSLAAVPFGTIVILLLIWMLLSFPLCLLGTVQHLLAHLVLLASMPEGPTWLLTVTGGFCELSGLRSCATVRLHWCLWHDTLLTTLAIITINHVASVRQLMSICAGMGSAISQMTKCTTSAG